MKADTFARLVVLDTLVEAEIGHLLAHRPPSVEEFREGVAGRVGRILAEIDSPDRKIANRTWSALVDFLAHLPEDDDGIEAAALRFRQSLNRVMERGVDRHDLADPAVWAAALEALLRALTVEYRVAMRSSGGRDLAPPERERVDRLLDAARRAADRMLWHADTGRSDLSAEMDRLRFAIRYRRLPPAEVETLGRSILRLAAKYRPSTISRVGAFVLRQLLGRRDDGSKPKSRRKRTRSERSPERKPGRAA